MAGTGTAHLRPADKTLLRAENLTVTYSARGRGRFNAVEGVSIDLMAGETVGIVGESGCGKSTTARAIMQLPRPDKGTITFRGTDLTSLKGSEMRKARAKMQMVLQDPHSSLNPRRTVNQLVAAGLKIWGDDPNRPRAQVVKELLESVGLDPLTVQDRLPHTLSGGQCQRVSIARSLVTLPEILVCDEPVSALDVSVQAQILNLLEDMKEKYHLSMLFIAHDLAVVKNISDRVIVLYLGKICEVGSPEDVFANPLHPYSRLLIDSIPDPHPVPVVPVPEDETIVEPIPMSSGGCRFRNRCPKAQQVCEEAEPEVRQISADHFVACHFPLS